MSEKIRTVNFPVRHLISQAEAFFKYHGCLFEDCQAEAFFKYHGCLFEDCSEHGIAYLKMTFPAGTTSTPVNPQGMEYRQILTFPDGTEVLEIPLRGRGSSLNYSQILRSEKREDSSTHVAYRFSAR